jgi:hypothetical protein
MSQSALKYLRIALHDVKFMYRQCRIMLARPSRVRAARLEEPRPISGCTPGKAIGGGAVRPHRALCLYLRPRPIDSCKNSGFCAIEDIFHALRCGHAAS